MSRLITMFPLLAIAVMASMSAVANADLPLIWKLRDTQLRWAKDRKEWERTALLLAKSPSVNLHLHKVDSARAAYFEAVVLYGDKVIEYCLLLLRGRDGKGERAESFVLMSRTPYEGTGEWTIVWGIVEGANPQGQIMEGVLPVVHQTSQTDIWALLERFEACPSAQPKGAQYAVMACVVFEDVWDPFISISNGDNSGSKFNEVKLKQPDSNDKK